MDLGGMNLKLHRCHDHRAELTQEVQSFTGETGHGLEVRSNDVMTEWQLVARFASHPDTDGWAIIFGDYVHCLRSALDHLVYAFAAASAAPNPPSRQRSVMMPLKTSPGEYKRVLRRLEDLDDITRAHIESLQPYDDRPTHKLLRMLEELDVRDKHRLISIVPLYPASMMIRLDGLEPGTTMTGPTPPTRMREGEPFTGWTFDRPAPNLRVDAGAQIHAFVRLDDTPGSPAYELFELADRLFWAARWATDTLLGAHEGGPILPPEPLTGYHVEISEEETNAIKR